MSLIKCPNCERDVSDKATICPGCGYQLISDIEYPDEPIKCEDCGQVLPENSDVCPNCGCPVSNSKEINVDDSNTEIESASIGKAKVKSKKAKIIIPVIIFVVLVATAVIVLLITNSNKKAKDYSDNLSIAVVTMLKGAAEAEDAGNLIKSVWYNTIYEKSDPETNKYTHVSEYSYSFNDDFNTSLANLFGDDDFQEVLSNIKSNQIIVESEMKNLQNPPDEYSAAYEELRNLYDAYLKLTNLVINPSGSLQTYSSNFNSADSDFSNLYSKMKIYI